MTGEKRKNGGGLPGRILSLEGILGLAGIFCLVSGLVTGEVMTIFWGVLAIAGLTVLHFIRKKDWAAHWEEMERLRQVREEQERRKSEKP